MENQNELNEMEQLREELRGTKLSLDNCLRMLDKTNNRLLEAQEKNKELVRVAKTAECLMEKMLFKWLSKESQAKVRNILRFYFPEAKLQMMFAMHEYVLTGHKAHFNREVAAWHFRIFCDNVGDDLQTESAHKWLMILWKKIGLI